MSTFKSHQEIVKELKHFSDKLASGELSLKELEAYQYLIRTLYERVIVLEYKAKEKYTKEKPVTPTAPALDTQNRTEKATSNEDIKTTKEPSEPSILFDFSTPLDEQQPVATEKLEPKVSFTKQDVNEANIEDNTPIKTEKTTESISPDQMSNFFDQFLIFNDDSLLGKLGASKIDSLKGAFGLNDRLQIINELFEGNSEAFHLS
ncbi:MAG: hypothetical protein JJT77_09880, partial [Crocinitomicaceae bacterium]|nr:hypothetical protein [Crocinitomicaceae bacterium]